MVELENSSSDEIATCLRCGREVPLLPSRAWDGGRRLVTHKDNHGRRCPGSREAVRFELPDDAVGGVERDVRVLATAELLCNTYVRHKPEFRDYGFLACDRCVGTAAAWDDWLARGEALARKRGVLG